MFSHNSIRGVGDVLGIKNVSEGALEEISKVAEKRLRILVEDAMQYRKHSNRKQLTRADIDLALRKNNVPPLYGHNSTVPQKFKSVQMENKETVYFLKDDVVKLEDVISAPLPPCPVEPTFTVHWLAVNGKQPSIPQNASAAELREALSKLLGDGNKGKKRLATHGAEANGVKTTVKHVLSREQQRYFEKVTTAVMKTENLSDLDVKLKQACYTSVRCDEGLHQLTPYFTQFIADGVRNNTRNLPALTCLMQLTECLLKSPYLHVDPYLHQLMPSVLTCIVGKFLCAGPSEDHWGLRQFSCRLIALVCSKYGHAYTNLQPRITKTLVRALLDPSCPLPTHYGSIVGLSAFGQHVTGTLIIPNVELYLSLLTKVLEDANPTKRAEAINCFMALRDAVGQYLRKEQRQGISLLLGTKTPVVAAAAAASTPISQDTKSMDTKEDGVSAEASAAVEHINTTVLRLFDESLQSFLYLPDKVPQDMTPAFNLPTTFI
jgi:transcription initiation factor TFIID subunit 6